MKKIYPLFLKSIFALISLIFISNNLISQEIFINEFMASNTATISDSDGDYPDWIELYNASGDDINLKNFYLSDDSDNLIKWQFPSKTLYSHACLLIWASDKDTLYTNGEIHTNFKISSSGEPLILTSSDYPTIIDQIEPISLSTDISYGRKPDGTSSWYYFDSPTPGQSNTTSGYQETLNPPVFSHEAGFYNNSFQLNISPTASSETVYYTLDGSEPTTNSNIYNGTITIESRIGDPNIYSNIQTTLPGQGFYNWEPPDNEVFKSTIIRAKSFKNGFKPSKTITKTYFVDPNINNKYTMDVVSIVSDPDNFFSDDIGIYVAGTGIDSTDWETAHFAQKGDAWERPIHLEVFNTNGELELSQDAGVRICGHYTRTTNIKSLRLYARSEYGESSFNFNFFPNTNQFKFKRVKLRNAGNDAAYAYLRDAFNQSLSSNLEFDVSDYRPIVLFIDGEYWGIHYFRERYDKYYFEENYGIDNDSLELLELNHEIIEGDDADYLNLRNFIVDNDMSNSSNYEYIKTQMDIDNYINYYASMIYSCQSDWPENNIRYWRKKTSSYLPDADYGNDGRWRWVMTDTDFGFARDPQYNYNYDMLNDLLNVSSGWSVSVLQNLLGTSGNQQFKYQFINTVADLLNTNFKSQRAKKHLDVFNSFLQPEIQEHMDRWNGIGNMNIWTERLDLMYDFIQNRPENLRQNIINSFNLGGTADLTLNVSDTEAGKIKINKITIEENTVGVYGNAYPWEGVYFKDVPVTLEAIPNPGYRFINWEGISGNSIVSKIFTQDISITANFEKIDLHINEILTRNTETNSDENGEFDDWIEIYNSGDEPKDIGGLYITNDLNNNTLYQIPTTNPELTTIPAKSYLILWADNQPEQGALHLGFVLENSNGQVVLIESDGNIFIDSLSYQEQLKNISYGRYPDGSTELTVFEFPTPGESNTQFSFVSNLYINEFLADNNSISRDNYGEFDDWIEIYNTDDNSIDIGGLYITDDYDEPFQWKIPKTNSDLTTVPANGFLILWADNDTTQGENHLGFKLNNSGEQIKLLKRLGPLEICIDSVSFGKQFADVSYGRYPDGSDNWQYFNATTPGASNISSESIETIYDKSFKLYQNFPNPFNYKTLIKFTLTKNDFVEIIIYNINGIPIKTLVSRKFPIGTHQIYWDGRNNFGNIVPTGIYFYRMSSNIYSEIYKAVFIK